MILWNWLIDHFKVHGRKDFEIEKEFGYKASPASAANNRPKAKDLLEMLRTSFGLER